MNVFVTGSKGFIGKNLITFLKAKSGLTVWEYDLDSKLETFREGLAIADIVYHLAGVNRPERIEEYETGNSQLTRYLCDVLGELNRQPIIVLSSSTQALQDNPYGLSKRKAEEAVLKFARDTGAPMSLFRLPSVFGKWCRPNYNSVVATFCHNIAMGLPISISDPSTEIELVYIDDVVRTFLNFLDLSPGEEAYRPISPSFKVTLGDLASKIQTFKGSRQTLIVPDFSDPFIKRLYATYLSYLEEKDFAYPLTIHEDRHGGLAEFLKQEHFGQLFISRTKPGIIRGNHFHHTKVEKFLVVEGEAIIRFKKIDREEILEYPVSGKEFKVVDIPPAYAHSIENVGSGELITLFWANEVFDLSFPDTVKLNVQNEEKQG
jgi:UDP-2-acetamido-2,6-beta-L-arabino-hexul-4-ose reductase